ncbi:MAG TPA: hypothetical protein PKY10_04520 [Lentisphaeria bacterium]|nr:hypothetical protein [Lentisphaeria bacterium]
MYSVSALFCCETIPRDTNITDKLWEEIIICIKCDENEIDKLTTQYFKKQEIKYKAEKHIASWKYVKTIKIHEPIDDKLDEFFIKNKIEIIEVFLRFLSDEQAQSLLSDYESDN